MSAHFKRMTPEMK